MASPAAAAARRCSSMAMLARNPDAAKTILALGSLVIVNFVPLTLVVTPLQGRYWGETMAQKQGGINLAMYALAFFAIGPLGRIGDRIGNQSTVAFATLVLALPSYVLLAWGPTALGLALWSVAKVVSGLSGSSLTGSPVCYALINEVSAPADVEAILGMAFAGVSLFWMLGGVAGIWILKAAGGAPRALLGAVAALSGLTLLLLAVIRTPASRARRAARAAAAATAAAAGGKSLEQGAAPVVVDAAPAQAEGAAAAAAGAGESVPESPQTPCTQMFASFSFACAHPSLRLLCISAALVSLPETVLADVLSQFAFAALGLLGDADAGAASANLSSRRAFVSFVATFSLQVALMVGSHVAGILASRASSRRVLLWTVPFSAGLQAAAGLVGLAGTIGAVAACGAMVGLSLMLLVPLQALVAQLAPPDRVSEAMGAVGAFKCMSSLLGNLAVACIVPLLQRTGMANPVWVLYPSCGLVTMIAFLCVLRLPAQAAAREADDKGAVKEEESVETASDVESAVDLESVPGADTVSYASGVPSTGQP